MKKILIFSIPIIFIIMGVFIAFGLFQLRVHEEKLMDDLKRKTKVVGESMELAAKYLLLNKDYQYANKLVERFQKRERLQGCVLYDKTGAILALTERFSDWKEKEKPYVIEVLRTKEPRAALEKFQQYTVYSYTLPFFDNEDQVLGAIEIIYDTSYVFSSLIEFWKRMSLTLIITILIVLGILLILYHQLFIRPVEHLTEWFHRYQRGEVLELHPIVKDGAELGQLANEVEQMALKLKVAQKSLSEQAALRVQQEELWTVDRLKDLIHAKLGENGFFVVSNREPYMHMAESVSGVVRCIRPASGVVTALDSIMSTCGGMWIAHGGGNADRKFVNSKNKLGVPPEDSRYILKRVWLNKAEEDGYYYGFSNEGLWPLCHNTHTRPVFRERDWQMYKKANQRFADAVLEEVPAKNPFIFIQDYHFTLLPQMIREKCPDAKIALFWHIPWPNSESFSICPFQKEILEGMLACDLIGFHVQYHCNNFFDTVNRFLECRIDMEKFSVVRSGYETFVKPFPISIDDKEVCFSDDDEKIRMIQEEREIKDMIIGVGVDRIDYTKGIVERLNAIDRFLEKYPSYRKKFVFIQIGAPSRVHIKSYHDLDAEIDEKVEKINWKYLDGNWKPILYLKKHFYVNEIRLYYKMADFCIVSSLHDGMNLVAKEYIMAKTDMNGVLLLSTFTGAWRELTEAIPINPYSIEEFADRIRLACEMPMDEKKKRMESLKKTIQEKNIYRWAGNIITEMTAIQKT